MPRYILTFYLESRLNDRIEFGVYDKEAELLQTFRDLPHWFQPGATTFITFRTIDSMPKSTLQLWYRQQVDWFRRIGIEATFETLDQLVSQLSDGQQNSFLKRKNQSWNNYLHQGFGECLLQRIEIANIVADALRFFDGDRYDLDCFVIMPNHVHVIVQFRKGLRLGKQTDSWLRFSATQINRMLGRQGSFWHPEPFDHLIRSLEEFEYLRKYVRENPIKAKLKSGTFLYWSRD